MKKILFICKYLSTRKNGFETRLVTLINLFNKNNYKILAITSSNSLKKFKFKKKYNFKKIDKVNYLFIKDYRDYSLYSLKRVMSWIKFEFDVFNINFKKINFKPDIIYVSSLSLLSILNNN